MSMYEDPLARGPQLAAKIKTEEARVAALKAAMEKFPDLREHRDRWSTIYHCAARAVPLVDSVEFGHSCGCCDDSPLYAFPYFLFNGLRIYSDPAQINIGCKWPDGGELADNNWQEQFKNFPPKIVEIIESYFARNPPYYPSGDEDTSDEE